MKYRRHHNNKGEQTCKIGKCARQLQQIAAKLGIPYKEKSAEDSFEDIDKGKV